MAERRMFAKTIVTSDAFLDMPSSARCLYFMLGMLADDDGFVNNPRSIMRQSGATTDDLNILIAKRFVLTFESGVVVIKHWCIHNTIQKDRYKETKYLEEKSQIALDENKAYTEVAYDKYPACIQDVSKSETQVRLGKDRIVKDNNIGDIPQAESPAPTKKRKVFQPPSIEEVQAYCRERGNNVDAERWHNHYRANGWMVGKTKMVDWKAAVRTWERNGYDRDRRPAATSDPELDKIF